MKSFLIWSVVLVSLYKLAEASVLDRTTTLLQRPSHELTPEVLQDWDSQLEMEISKAKLQLLSRKPRAASRKNAIKSPKTNAPKNNATSDVVQSDILDKSVKFMKQHPLKPITDMIVHGMNKDMIQPRTGLLLFGAITAIEIVTVSTLFFGTAGAMLLGLVAMVKFFIASSVIMLG